jgi:outer membrane protein TolC
MSRAQICPLLLSVSLSFAGCASYSGIRGEAHALAPQSLAFDQNPDAGGDWPRQDWWSMFREPKLDALVQQALRGNPSLRAAEARVRAARALADAAGASLYPSLDLNASATRGGPISVETQQPARETRP